MAGRCFPAAMPVQLHGDSCEAKQAQLRAAPMRFGSQRRDARIAFIRIQKQVEVELFKARLQVQIEEETADVDEAARSGAQPCVCESLIARHHGDGNRRARCQRCQLCMYRSSAARPAIE